MRRVQDLDVNNKKVLVRVDYNVPIKNGLVTNEERIKASLETVNYLIDNGASVVLCSHLGRPDGEIKEEFSLSQVVDSVEKLVKKSVQFVGDCIGSDRDKAVAEVKKGEIILLENLRFYPEEEENDQAFAKKLAAGCDLYVNDAFSASHRAHASIVGVADILLGGAGFQLQKEVDNLSKLLGEPEEPFVFVSGGSKVSDKIKVLENLAEKVDVMLIGGGMANTFLCADGNEVGCSLLERDFVKFASGLVEKMENSGSVLLIPEDVITTKDIKAQRPIVARKELADIEQDDFIADIGPNTIELFKGIIEGAKTVFWNGPLGVTEVKEFSVGTIVIAEAIANSDCYSVIGGGDTVASLPQSIRDRFDFVSMAGGASMEFLEGKSLPGIEVLA